MSGISIIGLGAMGKALAACFIRKGCAVTVWNRTPGKAGSLTANGAIASATAAEAVAASDLIVMCVLDYAAANGIVEAAASALSGRTLVNLTNGTPAQARDTAERVATLGGLYVDGGIMATPPMIGGEYASILYSGSRSAFDKHARMLQTIARAQYLGADAGLASLNELALLSGMYGVFAGALQAFALMKSEGSDAERLLPLLLPWLTAMMPSLQAMAKAIDNRRHDQDVASSLAMQAAGLENMLTAGRELGVDFNLIEPMARLIARRVEDGFGSDGISGVYELIRRKDG